MKILLKYYPPFDKITGVREESMEFPANITAGELLQFLSCKYPGLREYVDLGSDERQMSRLLIVQNGEFLKMNDIVKEGVVMVLFPIAGG